MNSNFEWMMIIVVWLAHNINRKIVCSNSNRTSQKKYFDDAHFQRKWRRNGFTCGNNEKYAGYKIQTANQTKEFQNPDQDETRKAKQSRPLLFYSPRFDWNKYAWLKKFIRNTSSDTHFDTLIYTIWFIQFGKKKTIIWKGNCVMTRMVSETNEWKMIQKMSQKMNENWFEMIVDDDILCKLEADKKSTCHSYWDCASVWLMKYWER